MEDNAKPWETEGDSREWEAHGYRCVIKRTTLTGALCGYVTIPDSHPWFGLSYMDDVTPIADPEDHEGMQRMDLSISVHGGVTYGGNNGYGWTLGFDCSHSGDYCPVSAAWFAGRGLVRGGEETYRDMDYVTLETKSLASQLRKVEERGTR